MLLLIDSMEAPTVQELTMRILVTVMILKSGAVKMIDLL